MDFIVNRRVLISMLFVGLTMLGYFSYQNLPLELFPNAEEPTFYIQVASASEVSPEYMEQQAIIPLEGAASTLEGVELIESQATANNGTITLSYNKDTNIKFAYLKLLEKVEQVRTTLPAEFNVNVVKSDLEMLNNLFMSLQVLGEGGVDRVRDITEKEIQPELENIDGVAGAQVFGGREKTMEIILNSALCEAYDITPNAVRAVLNQNSRDKAFVGEVSDGSTRQFVHVTAEYTSIRDIENLVIRQEGPVLLGDIAEVFFGVKEQTTLSRTNGLESVNIQLIRDSQVNMIDLSHKTQEVIEELNRKLASQNVEVVIQLNAAQIMEDNIDQIMELAIIGGLLAIFILWIFLRNVRLVLAIGVSIPISVYTAFNFFYAAGISINSLTLIGMALAIGMLVDNSVVVLENIYRHASMGKSRRDAVIQGTSEIRRSVFAATLTTVTIFLPFLFASEVFVKLIGTHIGVSIISTLVVSLFVSLLLIPMLTYMFMDSKNPSAFQRVSIHNKLIRLYIVLLKACMRKPASTVLTAVGVFFVTVFISLWISAVTSQEVETEELNMSITMESGSTLDMADDLVSDVESKLQNVEEIKDVVSTINEEDATLLIRLDENYEEVNNRSVADIRSDIIARTRDVNASSLDVTTAGSGGMFGGGGGGGSRRRGASGFQSFLGIGTQEQVLVVKGEDFEQMRKVAEDLEYYLDNLSSVQSVNLSINDNRPEVHMEFDQRLMSQYGLTLTDVTNELSGFQPEFNAGVQFKDGLETYDITIKSDEPVEDVTRSMEDLRSLEVESPSGSLHEMQEISDLFYSSGMWGISRTNQEKEIEVSYSFYTEYNQDNDLLAVAKGEVTDMLSSLVLPGGVAVEVLETEDQLAEYKFLIAAAAILIFMILASIFESLVTPFVLMFSIPLATIGSFLGLVLTGNSMMNPNSLTGLLILLGVVVNNSIILIDYSNILRKRGYNRLRALVTAGIGRVRPILITAITTIVAMIPLAMGQMEYVALIGAPFAITVIGGLAFSTLLTLLFIPTLNLGLENSIRWILDQKLWTKITMAIAFILGVYLILANVESTLWRALLFVLVTVGIPAVTYFILRSLAQASEDIIARDSNIVIRIENLVKIYGRPSKLTRDWRGGEMRSEQVDEKLSFKNIKDFAQLIWQIPLALFLAYFTYSYLEGGFWQLLFGVITYLSLLAFLRVVSRLGKLIFKSRFIRKTGRLFVNIIFWGFPAMHLAYLFLAWNNIATIALIIFIALVWYLFMFIYRTAQKLHGTDVKPEAMKGRFRRFYYNLVYKMPLIGKKQEPFKALKGVSLEIGNGMFGLLGPNGAGKTTLMRTVCGIFEQSYGKIWFNEFDSQAYREELQGLIGYLPQEFGMYENMTPWEYLNYQAILKGIVNKSTREERIKMVLESVNMYENRNNTIGSFSGGMKQRIGIAQILLHLPRILVVDEPTAGLDPRERIRFRNLLVELSRERIVIFSTHIIEDIASSCRNVAVLNRGELKYVGTPTDMAKIAEDRVWQFHVSNEEFERISKTMRIVHHMKEGDKVRVRCLSEEAPASDAIKVRPNLEDSYLWLMKDTGKVMSQLE